VTSKNVEVCCGWRFYSAGILRRIEQLNYFCSVLFCVMQQKILTPVFIRK